MIKGSVKKPFTVLVSVIAILVVGYVALTEMKTNLLPEMEMPYLVVVTTYPGASPQKIEESVTKPIEQTVGTINGVEKVTSSSNENYSQVMMEFAEDTSMDSAMVKVSSALNQLQSSLPDTCGTPNIIEISMDMMATSYVSVNYDGKDIYQLTDFVKKQVEPYFARQSGVARVSAVGMIEKSVEVKLNQDKIDAINAKVLELTNDKLDEAEAELQDSKDEISSARSELNQKESELQQKQTETTDQLANATKQLNEGIASKAAYESEVTSLEVSKKALEGEKKAYEDNKVKESYDGLTQMFSGIYAAVAGMEAQLGEMSPLQSAKMPQNIDEAIADHEKLKYFKKAVKTLAEMPEPAIDESTANQALQVTAKDLEKLSDIVTVRMPQIETELANLEVEILAAKEVVKQLDKKMDGFQDAYVEAEKGKMSATIGFGSGNAQLEAGKTALDDAKKQLDDADETFKESAKEARKNANIDKMLTLESLSGMIYAQNFEMPAGYVDDKDDKQWLLKVGESYEAVEDLENMVLCNIDDIGDIHLKDVADLVVVDNADLNYMKVNGDDAVALAIFKGSTAGASDVSKVCKKASLELEKQYEGLHITSLMDQGDYISIIINSLVSSMVIGAVLAIVILAIFLLDVRPTLVVAFSIPFSVLTAIVIMYFTGISINMMSLSGLALGVGMLVDNSIVVIENIYRLRYRGLEAPRAAVQGGKQVAGPILSSTLTTICVFFPMVFTTGMVRQMMLPFALTISFSLIASLVVALTVVPAMGSVLLKKVVPREHKITNMVQKAYAKVLYFFLKVKVIPLVLAVGMLVFSIYQVIQMGIVIMPQMDSDQIVVMIDMPEESEKEERMELADQIMDKIMAVEGVDFTGIMDAQSETAFMGMAMSESDFMTFECFVIPKEEYSNKAQVARICDSIEADTADLGCEVTASSSMMGEMDQMFGSGLQIDIFGSDLDKLRDISEEIMGMVGKIDGFEDISNGQEDAEQEIHLLIDKDESMRLGLTGAQIYGAISDRMTTDKSAVTLTIDDSDMEVKIVDETDLLTKENLMDMEFEVTEKDEDDKDVTKIHKLSEFARLDYTDGILSIQRANNERQMSVTAATKEGYNTTLLTREISQQMKDYELPEGYSIEIAGEASSTADMMEQMTKLLLLGALLIYLVMVAQFQSLLSPFIVIFTIPLAFTGGLFGLLFTGEQLSIMSLIGFLVLMGTVVNNGIVFVDYANQLRLGGMERRDALVATGKTRMRPILMTAFTTILAMMAMIFSKSTGSEMGRGMAIVVAGGLAYATFMTLFIIPVMYDLLYRKEVKEVDVGDESLDDVPDDAAEFMEELKREQNHMND